MGGGGANVKIIFAGHWLVQLPDVGMLEGPTPSGRAVWWNSESLWFSLPLGNANTL